MKALISPLENNRVVQIEATEFPVAEPLYWVDCADEVETEWTYNDGQFSAPAYLATVEPTKAELMAELAALTAKIQALGA